MTMLQVKLDLRDGLAKEAGNLGLLEPQARQTMLREAVRRRHIARLTEARERIAAAGIPPLTMERDSGRNRGRIGLGDLKCWNA